MTRFLRVMLIALTLVLMGARDLPRPCIGDGQGNPCAISQCQCTARCSCRSVCGQEASMAAEDAACHMHASDGMPASLQHVTLPDPPPPTLLAAKTVAPLASRAPAPILAPARRLHSLSLHPPVPPPRIAA